MEQLCMASFLHNGHRFVLYVYDEVEGIPDGVIVADANEILPRSEIFTTHKGSLAFFSDWFRQELMFRRGGYWVDTDVICLRRFDFSDPCVFGLESSTGVGSAVLRFPPGHEVTRTLSHLCGNPNTIMPYDPPRVRWRKRYRRYLAGNRRNKVKWGEAAGPRGITAALHHFGLFEQAKPFPYFFPVHNSCWRSLYDETFRGNLEFFHGSYSVHFWNEVLRRQRGFDKNASFPEDSLIEVLKRRYLR
jgi:hypothetical protein